MAEAAPRAATVSRCDGLEALASQPGTGLQIVLTDPPEGWTGESGYVDKAMLGRLFDQHQLESWLFVLCGPPPMLTSVEDALISLNVPADRIVSEKFDYD